MGNNHQDISIAKCCRHVPKYKRAGGYVWEYKENYGD
jgi:hypothetical protein